ncbi:GNVR domain-containing protein [Bacterioplanoides sp.]|uniref:GNVR domain-containing protein n=1 Tax=Bacterioplanoides sp. TaxID=2066072 RepID=UPI003B0061F7
MSNNSAWKNVYLILIAAWRQRYLIIIPILLLPLIGAVIGKTRGKIYDTHTTILIQETSKLNPFLEDLSVSTNLKERMAALDTLLHSRHVLSAVVDELQLTDDTTSDSERNQLMKRLASGIQVNQMGKDLVQISYRSGDPGDMKQILEVVSLHFVEQLLAPERSSIAKSEEFIREQINQQKSQLLLAEQALSAFKQKNAAILPAFHGGNVKRLRELRQLLAQKEVELAGASAAVSSIDQQLSSTNPVVGALEKRIVALTSELALLRARYTNQHSRVISVQRQLEHIKQKRNGLIEKTARLTPQQIEKLWNLAMSSGLASSAAQAEIDVPESVGGNQLSSLLLSQLEDVRKSKTLEQRLQQEITSLKQQIQHTDEQVHAYASVEQEMIELERDLDTRKNLYNEFLKRYEMAKVTGSLGKFEEKNRIKIIDEPFTPTHPSNLPVLVFVISGLIGGIALGAGLALITELMDTSIRRSDQLQQFTQAPVLSRIPKLQPLSESDCYFSKETLNVEVKS